MAIQGELREMEVNLVIKVCNSLTLLLMTVIHHVPALAMRVIPHGYTKSRKI